MTYSDALKQAMHYLAQDQRTVFIGYNINRGSRAYGTLNDVPPSKCIEMPIAENLMVGLAIGMVLEGFRPILYFERHDFILNAMDALVNHLDKIESISDGQYKVPVIIRAVIGGTRPFYPGPQHIQDFSEILKKIFHFSVKELKAPGEIVDSYKDALISHQPTMLIERRDWYGKDSK